MRNSFSSNLGAKKSAESPRIEILNRRQSEQRNHLERLNEKMEQMDTESEKYYRFSDVCKELNQSIESRDEMIKKLKDMRHNLHVIAKFELS